MSKIERVPFAREKNTFIIRFGNGISCRIQLLSLYTEQNKSYSIIEQMEHVLFCSAAYVKVKIINECTLEDLTSKFVETKDGVICSPEQLFINLQDVFRYVNTGVVD